ncbi:DUF4062 domain-containing protein [Paenibacillus humicola]|uniref:DUF4062 domain-containing protein n=1 Tax=Paenibacillus humicola TaxID=3110540 RepID=UPI00237B0952|nr:DUF4062 domain-containing protein [Paenibacillus humicola]
MATKMFISSVSGGLEEIRQQVASFIAKAGHEPILFEADAFAKNQAGTMIATCLRAVEQAHIYILIIGYEVGYFVHDAGKSVTHLELRKAIAAGKTIYVFAEEYIKNFYFKEYLRIYRQLRDSEDADSDKPPSFEAVIRQIGSMSVKREVLNILNDAYQVVPWVFGFQSSDDIVRILKQELSASLEAHIALRNSKQLQSLDKVMLAAERFEQYNRFMEDFFPLVDEIRLTRFEELLRKTQSHLKGGTICYDEGAGIISELVTVGNCDATSLYYFDGEGRFELVALSGLAHPRQTSIPLHDPGSYVASAYREAIAFNPDDGNRPPSTEIFYTDQTIYLCHVFGRFVFTIHFPIEDQAVDAAFLDGRTDDLYAGLLNIKANSDILELIRFILCAGGNERWKPMRDGLASR